MEKIASICLNNKILDQKSITDLSRKGFSFHYSSDQTMNKIFFSTNEGTIGIICLLSKEIFEYLKCIQNKILDEKQKESIFNLKNYYRHKVRLNNNKKDIFLSNEDKGFIKGDILEEYLKFSLNDQKIFLRNLDYPNKKNFKQTKKIIELLLNFE